MLKNIKTVQFRRKREGKTDYKKRLKILVSKKIRIVVRKSLKNIYAQLTEYKDEGDIIKVSASSREIRKFGWKANCGNIPTSYLTGYLLGRKAIKKNLSEVVLDIGISPPIKGSRIFAVVKGAKDAGIKIHVDSEMLPTKGDVEGNKISDYAKLLSKDTEKYNKYFSSYLKTGIRPEDISIHFLEIKRILESTNKTD